MTAAPVLKMLRRVRPLVYYAGGVGLLGRFDDELATVLRRAKAIGAMTFVDVVSPYGKTWAFLRRALPHTDVFHCNADEARAITGRRDAARAAAAIRGLGAGNVLVTLGGRGAVAAVAGSLLRVPAFKVRVVDPTGAGDAFSAGVILKTTELLASGRRPEDLTVAEWSGILIYASACGAVCTTGVGTTTAVRSRDVEALAGRRGTGAAGAAPLRPVAKAGRSRPGRRAAR
ncbi:MAG TPA: carbohydrate kinase family protein, partial [Frankiaceae bacterium]|nr:carbohydrate kinase family protein [Frankiaceae bacterium]